MSKSELCLPGQSPPLPNAAKAEQMSAIARTGSAIDGLAFGGEESQIQIRSRITRPPRHLDEDELGLGIAGTVAATAVLRLQGKAQDDILVGGGWHADVDDDGFLLMMYNCYICHKRQKKDAVCCFRSVGFPADEQHSGPPSSHHAEGH